MKDKARHNQSVSIPESKAGTRTETRTAKEEHVRAVLDAARQKMKAKVLREAEAEVIATETLNLRLKANE